MGSEKDADSLMKKAEKLLRPSVLAGRLKPAWDDAMPLFEQAAQQFKFWTSTTVQFNDCYEKAIIAYEKAAEANVRGGGTAWHAAKHMEDAAKLSLELRNYSQVQAFSKQACQYYIDCGKATPAAECLARAARWLEAPDPGLSCDVYLDAVDTYARSEMAALAHDVVQRAFVVLLRAKRVDDAASVMLRWATVCYNSGSTSNLCRAYLGIIVLQLHAGSAEQAWASYQDFLDVEEFSSSAEAYAAENLLEAYCSGNVDMIKQKASKGNVWRAVDTQVAQLARELPTSSTDLKQMSKFLNDMMHEGEDVERAQADDDDDFLT